jgi:hypothetical protein
MQRLEIFIKNFNLVRQEVDVSRYVFISLVKSIHSEICIYHNSFFYVVFHMK